MRLINFNRFHGFEPSEDIFVDTGVLLGFLNEFDAWHSTVNKLFTNHILNNSNEIIFYTHSGVVNEISHLAEKPLKQFIEAFKCGISEEDIIKTAEKTIEGLAEMIEQDYLEILESNKTSTLQQIKYSRKFGSIDSMIASIVQEYGISLLTVDQKLARKIQSESSAFSNIRNIYYTDSSYTDY
ncbi:PIN domain-containing protein [Desulfosporosinus sp. FKA]|uniref:PIN domain-containing protein n=1 Tax=Desulfosporosinus sp. FKA TaxID=1969834 RepID=UPI000B4A15A2|nr:PIN domain-containing protein [Desulfosporosinus sp. FKA]